MENIRVIKFTERLDKAIRIAAWAHEQAHEHRKGGDIPYIIHPFGVMLIAGNVTDDENTLIACLLHDVLEDVPTKIYNEESMAKDFGDKVLAIVKDVTKDRTIHDWYEVSKTYLQHLEFKACEEAIVVSLSDKTHNLESTLFDYKELGDKLWNIFTTKNSSDQLWWYTSVLEVGIRRKAPESLTNKLSEQIEKLKKIVN
jgi:(p)ppGpp synthase/HD superfamily hydrolase